MNIPQVVVLISGRGSNLQSLIQHAWHYQITAVISNKKNATGLHIARNAGIKTASFEQIAKGDTTHRQQIYKTINQLKPDFVALAGFMEIIDAEFVHQWEGRLINIHPSLLPEFRGLHTHQRALQRFHDSKGQYNQHGCSVHFVDVSVDTGPVIAQAKCTIREEDNEDQLAQRVLELEHRLFPWVMNNITNNNIRYNQATIHFSQQAITEAQKSGFLLPRKD